MSEIICQEQKIILNRRLGTHSLKLHLNRRGEVVLNLPFFYPTKQALSFIQAHQDWINRQKALLTPPLHFTPNQSLSILGQHLTIHHRPNDHFATHIDGDILYVSGDASFLNRRVTDFIRHQTQCYIQTKAPQLAAQIGQKINRISLKDTTSRWGSCSGKKNLNFAGAWAWPPFLYWIILSRTRSLI